MSRFAKASTYQSAFVEETVQKVLKIIIICLCGKTKISVEKKNCPMSEANLQILHN